MYELLLNAARVLVSKEAREAGRDLLKLVQNSPEWKKDICTLTLRLDVISREQAALIRELSAHKLEALRYPKSVIDAFETIYVELTTNAFEHGIINTWWRKGTIEIDVEITESYVALVVYNSRGVLFDFEKTCEKQSRLLTDNPQSPRGRGLLTVKELGDEVFSLENGRAIKAVLYWDCVTINFFRVEQLAVFTLLSGVYNPSLVSRLEYHVLHYPGHDVILDFSRFGGGRSTKAMGLVHRLREKLARVNQRVVVINPREGVNVDVTGVHSWREALERVDRLHLLGELARRGFRDEG